MITNSRSLKFLTNNFWSCIEKLFIYLLNYFLIEIKLISSSSGIPFPIKDYH